MFIVATVLKASIHPILLAFATSGILMLVVSQFTPKVKRGIFEVWFAENYDESYANIHNVSGE